MSNLGKNILKEAEEIINGPRRESYGSADKSFQLIADLWSSYLDFPITKRDVANLMILLKVARDQNRPKHDNQLDIIGYAALADGFEKEERLTGPCHSGHAPCSRPGNREAQDFEEKNLAKAYEKDGLIIEDSPSSSNISSRRIKWQGKWLISGSKCPAKGCYGTLRVVHSIDDVITGRALMCSACKMLFRDMAY